MDKLVAAIKDSMRIRHSALDESIKSDIAAATADLVRVGVQPYTKKNKLKDDHLIKKVIELYCKAQADYLGKGPWYEASYESLRDALSLCGDYHE